jgi:soluble lytic murein transglycosylase-like protein
MPATAAGLGVTDPTDPAQALDGGAKYLREQLDRFGGDVSKALAAYNAGPGAVERFGGIPPYAETQEYVRRVQANAAEYRGSAGPTASPLSAVPAPPLSTSPSAHGIL